MPLDDAAAPMVRAGIAQRAEYAIALSSLVSLVLVESLSPIGSIGTAFSRAR